MCVCVCVCVYIYIYIFFFFFLQHACKVWLCVNLWTVACQAPLSMGFSRQEYWSGLPWLPPGALPDPGIKPESLVSPALAGMFFFFFTTSATGAGICINICESHSVISDSLWPQGLYSPWTSLGQNTGVGSLSLLQGIFPTQRLNPGLLHCRWILYQLSHQGSPICHNKTQLDENNIFLKLWAEATVSVNANVMRGVRRKRKQGMDSALLPLGKGLVRHTKFQVASERKIPERAATEGRGSMLKMEWGSLKQKQESIKRKHTLSLRASQKWWQPVMVLALGRTEAGSGLAAGPAARALVPMPLRWPSSALWTRAVAVGSVPSKPRAPSPAQPHLLTFISGSGGQAHPGWRECSHHRRCPSAREGQGELPLLWGTIK